MDRVGSFVERAGVLVLDGGLATELERRGADLRDPLWSARVLLDQPELIRDVHLEYFRAGADLATTASYQASLSGFTKQGVDRRRAISLIGSSVALARHARAMFWASPDREPDRVWPLIAGSVGPYGAALADGSEYRGHYGVGRAELMEFHRPRLEVLVDAAVDVLAMETIPSLDEADALLELLAERPTARAWFSFTTRDAKHLSEGQPIEEAARLVSSSPQVIAVGVNCVPPRRVDALLARLRNATDLPLVVYPNSGERWDATLRCWCGEASPLDSASAVQRWRAAGARLIGGCCRTTPANITAIRDALTAPYPVTDSYPVTD